MNTVFMLAISVFGCPAVFTVKLLVVLRKYVFHLWTRIFLFFGLQAWSGHSSLELDWSCWGLSGEHPQGLSLHNITGSFCLMLGSLYSYASAIFSILA